MLSVGNLWSPRNPGIQNGIYKNGKVECCRILHIVDKSIKSSATGVVYENIKLQRDDLNLTFCVSLWTSGAVLSTSCSRTFDACGVFSICCLTIWRHEDKNFISRAALRVTSWALHYFIWEHYHQIHTKTQRFLLQPTKIKVWFNLKKLWQKCITFVKQNVHLIIYFYIIIVINNTLSYTLNCTKVVCHYYYYYLFTCIIAISQSIRIYKFCFYRISYKNQPISVSFNINSNKLLLCSILFAKKKKNLKFLVCQFFYNLFIY